MAFQNVANVMGGSIEVAPPKDLSKFKMKAGEVGVYGEVCKFHTDGTLTKAAADDLNAAVILMESVAAGADVRAFWITPGMVFKAPATGDSNNAYLGANLKIDSTATGADVATTPAAGYPLTVVGIDEESETVKVAFNSCALALNTVSNAS